MSKKSSQKCLRFLRNSSLNTIKTYNNTIKKYEEFHGMSIDELVDEAIQEQEERVPLHRLSIIDRIEDFQDELVNQGLVIGTIRSYITQVKTIYHKNRVDLPYIEPINAKRCNKRDTIEFKDILTKDELRKALPLMRLPLRARVMAMIQGGLSNEECEHLTTRSFIDELRCYHKKDDDVEALKWLSDENHPVIWITKLIRVKTGKPYYAIIGAEAVNIIAESKLYEMDLPSNKGEIPSKLFDTHKISLNKTCSKLNRRLGLGKAGGQYRLRPHMLRKFHSTHIRGSVLSYEDNVRLSNSQIDEMQGRGKTSVQDTYIKTNPIEQKLIYAKVINNVSLYHQYDYEVIDGDVVLSIRNLTSENQKLKNEVKKLSNIVEKKKKASEKVDALREELGEDSFRELLSEILSGS